MKERQKELRRMAYIIHVIDNPDICLDLDDYFQPQYITKEKIEEACIEFDSIYPIPSNFTNEHIYEDCLRVLFDTSTRNMVNTTFNGLKGIRNLSYKAFLERLLSVRGPLFLTEEQFEYLYALKFNPDWLIELYKRRVRMIGSIYSNGFEYITKIKDRKSRINALISRIAQSSDHPSTDKLHNMYSDHISHIDSLLDNAEDLDLGKNRTKKAREYAKKEEYNKIIEEFEASYAEKILEIRAEKARKIAKLREEKLKDIALVTHDIDMQNNDIIRDNTPDIIKYCKDIYLKAIYRSIWFHWLHYRCNIPIYSISVFSKFNEDAVRNMIESAELRLDLHSKYSQQRYVNIKLSNGQVASLPKRIAIASDFYLVDVLMSNGISIDEFKTHPQFNEFAKFLSESYDLPLKALHSARRLYRKLDVDSKGTIDQLRKGISSILRQHRIKIQKYHIEYVNGLPELCIETEGE